MSGYKPGGARNGKCCCHLLNTESSRFTLEFEQLSQRRGQTLCVSIPELWDPLQSRLPTAGISFPPSMPLCCGAALSKRCWLPQEGRQSTLGLVWHRCCKRGTTTSNPPQPPLLPFPKCHCGTLRFPKQCLSLLFDCLGQ